jgi:hypothetical protein
MPDGTVTTLAGEVGLVGTSDGTGPDALFNTPEGLALDPSGNLYVADTYNCTIRKGNPALPDAPVVDTPFAPAETIRHFNITNFTAKNWTWSIVRHPSTSTNAALSSATAQNPTLTPDVNDLFVVRFYGTNSQGQVTMGTLAIANDLTPPSVQITMPDPGQEVQSSPFYIYGTASDDVEVAAVWYQLNGGPWAQAVGTLTWVDQISSTLQGQNTLSVYAVDGSGKFSATNSVVFTYGVEAKVTPGAGGLGFLTNQFGFHITGTSNLSVVVQASANLASGQWTPVSTNVLSGGATYFSDPQWTNYPARYYRLVWQ